MEIEEIDQALDELEVRLERLRALYEQYFLGIEKIEPTVARKDVDRRIYVLRREKIRNTGRRFKLQTLIMRYNTFQQYWQRVCREIENGTYRRHLLRAERTFGPTELLTVAARRRFGKERDKRAQSAPPSAATDATPPSSQSTEALPSNPPSSRKSRPSVVPRSQPRASEVPPPRSSHAPRPSRRPPSEGATALQTGRASSLPPLTSPAIPHELAAQPSPPAALRAEARAPSPEPKRETAPPPARHHLPPTMRPPKSIPAGPYESLELDMDFMGDWDPMQLAPRHAQRRLGPPVKPARAGAPGPTATKPSSEAKRPPEAKPPAVAARAPGAAARPAPAAAAASPAAGAPPAVPANAPTATVTAPPVGAPATPPPAAPERRRPHRSTHPGLAPPPPGTPGPADTPALASSTSSSAGSPAASNKDVERPQAEAARAIPAERAPGPTATPAQRAPTPAATPAQQAPTPAAATPAAATPAAATPAQPPQQAPAPAATAQPSPAEPSLAAAQARKADVAARHRAETEAREARKAQRPAQPAGAASKDPGTALTEQRLRELHRRLLESTQKTNQPSVSLEGMSRSLKAAEARLRAQYGGNRRIDFEVVISGGKAVLKPIIR